jgi:hypothetical protein
MILVSQQINAHFPSEPHLDKQVEIYLEIYPILKSSLLLAHLAKQGFMAQKESAHTINAHDIVRVGQLIDNVNRNYPTDSFSPLTLFALLSHNILSADEIDILKNTLPRYNGTTNTRITANINGNTSVNFSNAMKHSGMFYNVSFTGNYGLSFPVTMTLTTYTDMDNLKNHQEFDGDSGCPFRNQFWICPNAPIP